METFSNDLRYAIRMLLKHPGHTTAAVLMLGLGLGVNIAVFSLLNAILLQQIPVPRSERLVSIYRRNAKGPGRLRSISYPDYEYYRDHNEIFSGLLAFARLPTNLRAGDHAEAVSGEMVTGNYFSVLGVKPILGRTFLPEEDRYPGGDLVVVISHVLWQNRFGGDPHVIGQTIRLHDSNFKIIGVAPKGFHGTILDWGPPPQLWVPINAHRGYIPALSLHLIDPLRLQVDWLLVTGRLKDSVTSSNAQAVMDVLNTHLQQEYPDADRDCLLTLIPSNQARFWPEYRRNIRIYLTLLSSIAGLALLIACFNLANHLLAQASKRRKEIAVRLALGAGSQRLIRQLVTESLLLAISGGMVGLVLAGWTGKLLADFPRAFKIPLTLDLATDGRVLTYALFVTLLTLGLFGLLPVRQALKTDLVSDLKLEASRWQAGGLGLKNCLVIIQIAGFMVLLVVAGLFLRTLFKAQSVDVTRDPDKVLMASLELATYGYSDEEARRFYHQLMDRVRALPGVQAAGLVWDVPLSGMESRADLVIYGTSVSSEHHKVSVNVNVVSEGYFGTIGIPIVLGRDFAENDIKTSSPVAIINREMARQFWPGEDPLGKQFMLVQSRSRVQVVGMVSDGKKQNYRESKMPCLYLPLYQELRAEMNLQVRVVGDPSLIITPLRHELVALDKTLPLGEVKTMRAYLNQALSQERMTVALLSGLSLLTLVLVTVGLYSVISLGVAGRTRDIGIRMALGARPRDVLRMVLGTGIGLVVIGIGSGLILAGVATRWIRSMLYGISPGDWVTFGLAPLCLFALALLACYIPARRAAKVDPMVALRYE
jgi:putative ABC transport system permease protein